MWFTVISVASKLKTNILRYCLDVVMLDFTLLRGSSALKRCSCRSCRSCPCPRIQKSLQHCVDSLGQAIFSKKLLCIFCSAKTCNEICFKQNKKDYGSDPDQLEHIIESMVVFDSLLRDFGLARVVRRRRTQCLTLQRLRHLCLFDVGNGHLHVKFAALAATLYSLTGQN